MDQTRHPETATRRDFCAQKFSPVGFIRYFRVWSSLTGLFILRRMKKVLIIVLLMLSMFFLLPLLFFAWVYNAFEKLIYKLNP